MATDPHFMTAADEPKRDRYGRYLLPDPETGKERPWTRVTTVSGILSDRYNLELWAQRMVALGLAKRTDLLGLVKTNARTSGTPQGKRTLNRIVKDALEAGNDAQRANLGTMIHAATEAFDRGEEVDIPEPYDRDVEAYAAKMAALEIEPLWIERIVLNTELGLAGTLDRLVVCGDWTLPRVSDIKTGATVHFAELDHAIQLSMYANASHFWNGTELEPMPEVDKRAALIVHLPAGTAECKVHELDIATGYEAARLAVAVKQWRTKKGLSAPFNPADWSAGMAQKEGK